MRYLIFSLLLPFILVGNVNACNNSDAYLVDSINQIRAANKLQPLLLHTNLSQSATIKAYDMVEYKYFSHYPTKRPNYIKIIRANGFTGKHIGENLARWFNCNEEVVAAWMKSPGHRANILNGYYSYIGVSSIGSYKVIHFGTK
jgi:uncharacterized protein YkwD